MKILVYPHAMELGGSQLNAIELAAAVRDLGHNVTLYSEDGPLTGRVEQLGLPRIPRTKARRTPSPGRAASLGKLLNQDEFDIVHGYEWPPILEGYAASGRATSAVAVGTVMSMAVADFLPGCLPLVVGTERIRQSVGPRGGEILVIEPPVDTVSNHPDHVDDGFLTRCSAPDDALRVMIVSRLVPELKLEGILTSIRAVGVLAERSPARSVPFHLTVVGDGSAMQQVQSEADHANSAARAAGRPDVVCVMGELADPRSAYAAADIAIAMGGSALRSLAFGVPLVVQGEEGFFEILDDDTLPTFLSQGFYGVGLRDADAAVNHLIELLGSLGSDPGRRQELGRWGRKLAEDRFSLTSAAVRQVEMYERALAAPPSTTQWLREGLRVCPGLLRHQLGRRVVSRFGEVARDDFNARPV